MNKIIKKYEILGHKIKVVYVPRENGPAKASDGIQLSLLDVSHESSKQEKKDNV